MKINELNKSKCTTTLTAIRKREKIDGWLFVLPYLILLSIFFIGPLFVSVMLSFKQYSFLDSTNMFNAKWVGLKNYIDAINDTTFKKALLNTFIYSIVVVPSQLVIALILAMIVNKKIKGRTFFRAAYYIPTLTSTVAVSVMFLFMFKSDGIINKFLGLFGIKGVNWFGDVKFSLPSIMLMCIWATVGLYMIIFLGGLNEIPMSVYESSMIDGANKAKTFFYITLPLLKPTVFFNFIVAFIAAFKIFDQPYVVSNGTGGPMDSTMTVVLYLYRCGFADFKMGYASAIAFILFIIIFAITIVQKKLFGEETKM